MLHAFYGLGCAISPIVATRMIAAGLGWNSYYFVLLGWAILNTILLGITYHPKFMKSKAEDEEVIELPAASVSRAGVDGTEGGSVRKGPLMVVVTNRFCWLVALYLVLYLGLEISTGGWVVEFMIQVPTPLPSKLPQNMVNTCE